MAFRGSSSTKAIVAAAGSRRGSRRRWPQPALVERGVLADDHGRHPLAATVVGQAEHGRLLHAWAVVDHPLDDLRDRR